MWVLLSDAKFYLFISICRNQQVTKASTKTALLHCHKSLNSCYVLLCGLVFQSFKQLNDNLTGVFFTFLFNIKKREKHPSFGRRQKKKKCVTIPPNSLLSDFSHILLPSLYSCIRIIRDFWNTKLWNSDVKFHNFMRSYRVQQLFLDTLIQWVRYYTQTTLPQQKTWGGCLRNISRYVTHQQPLFPILQR